MVMKRSALGRGLDALITMDDLKTGGSSSISEIELSKIQPNPDQPRSVFEEETLEELAVSIRSLGVIQPITLKETGTDKYMIISGERRYRASLMAGLERIPAYIKTAADENVVEMALIENIQREDLNSIEIALAYQKLIDSYGLTQEKLSERVGKKRATIANYLRLLRAWRKEYAPHSPEEAFHPRFVEALQKQAHVEYLLDVLLFGETEEKAALITDYGKDVIQLEQRMAELAAADAARTKKHHERHAATPEH